MRVLFHLVIASLCCMSMTGVGFAQDAPPVPFADFETGTQGWYTEEHADALIWTEDETAGPASMGAISIYVDPSLPSDDSPESKIQGQLPEGINMADYQYISFYYMCDNEAYTGSTMFVMPMNEDWSAGAGASHSGTMLGDGKWHYEEYHMSEFENWWGEFNWEDTYNLVLGIWETAERGEAEVWYDHVMLFNESGEGILLAEGGVPEVIDTNPAAGSSVSVVNEITVIFDQEVSGVAEDGSDLLVNGEAASAVETNNNRTFTFSGFPTPEVGTVEVELLPGSIVSNTDDAFEGYTFNFTKFAPKEYSAPFVETPPALDGVIEAGEYPGAFRDDWTDNLGTQDPESDADWSDQWSAAHDDEYFYIVFQTQDDVRETAADPWNQDNLEVFIDGPNLKTGEGTQFRVNWDGAEWVSSAAGDWEWSVGDTDEGWIVEARFSKETMEIPLEGMMGFNLQPSDNDDGTRGLYHFWADSPDNNNPWNDASAWGNVVLEPDTVAVLEWTLY